MRKKLLIFIPSIEGGGVEKNLFILSNYLKDKINNISLITISNKFKNRFSGKIKFISPKIEEAPATCKLKIAKSIAGPG